MELKMYPRRAGVRKDFICCFCIHVRTGAKLIGLWHLVMNAMIMIFLINMMAHPEIKGTLSNWPEQQSSTSSSVGDNSQMDLPSPLPPQLSVSGYSFVKEACTQDIPVALVLTMCTGGITLFMLFGISKGRPNYIIPFYCLQIFDLVVSALTAVGYFSYMPNVRRWIEQYKNMPFQKEFLALEEHWLCAIMMLAFFLCIVIKSYLMGIVWACYKFLKFEQISNMVHHLVTVDGEMGLPTLLAPDYELISKMPPPPPPYYPSNAEPTEELSINREATNLTPQTALPLVPAREN